MEHTLRTFNLLYLSTGLGNFGKIYYFETYGSKKTRILAYFAQCMGNMWKCMLQLNQIHAAVQSLSARTIFQIFRFYCCDHDNSISILTGPTLNREMGRRGLNMWLPLLKNVHIRSYSGPYFPVLRVNTERYFVLGIHSECGKKLTSKTPNTDLFTQCVLSYYYSFIRSSHQTCSVKNVLLKIWRNSQENNCARFSFLIRCEACNKKNLAQVFCEVF